MFMRIKKVTLLFVYLILSLSLGSCDVLSVLLPTATPTATNTPLPSPTPLPTDTPEPTATFTPEPTDTPSLPPTEPPPPTPDIPTATLTKDQAVLVYYINKNEKGPYGCGEALWYVKTTFPKTGNIPMDVGNAFRTILSFHSDTIGILYNPGYASNLAVSEVQLDGGNIKVYLTGTYVKTKDSCDASRFKDQLRFTIKQFPGIQNIAIYINGTPIADAISRK
jgi:hypothetical protein